MVKQDAPLTSKVHAPEEIGRHTAPESDHHITNATRFHLLSVPGAHVSAQGAADEHEKRLRPEHGPGHNEHDHGHGVSAGSQQGLKAVHPVNVLYPHHSHQPPHPAPPPSPQIPHHT